MKRMISLILCFVLMASFAACGSSSSELAEPDNDTLRKDVQDYITELVDKSAQITIFEKTDSARDGEQFVVTCIAMFGSGGEESKGTFTLTYVQKNSAWELDKCHADLENDNAPQISAQPSEPESDTTEPAESTTQESNIPTNTVAAGTYGYTLTQVGTFADSDCLMQIQMEAPTFNTGNGIKALTYLGEDVFGQEFQEGEYLGNGFYTVRSTSTDVNSWGLISQDGEVLIPCEATMIEWASNSDAKTTRYLKVIYTTGETTNENECFVFSTDRMLAWGPEDGDVMYKGYAKVYDTVQRQFIENVTITNPDASALRPCGNSFLVESEDGTTTLYDSNGNNLFQTVHYVREVGGGIFVVSDEGTYCAYDETGTQTYASDRDLYVVLNGEGAYLKTYQDDLYALYDCNGNQVLEEQYESIQGDENDFFMVMQDDKEGLIRVDGSVVVPCEYDSLFAIAYNYYYASKDNTDGYTIIGPDGVIAEGVSASGSSDLCFIDDENQAIVLNTGKAAVSFQSGYPKELTYALVADKSDSNGMYCLIDLFTGNQLLPYEYEEIEYAAGYVYAYKNGSWLVFELNGPINE